MIKVRYSDLPSGLHARADVQGRHTVIYLLPGLTPAQRRAALHRVRSSARMGYSPALPAAAFARAIAADRIRITLRNGAGALRAHPALFIPPLMIFVSAGLAYLMLTAVSIHYQPEAIGPGQAPAITHQGQGSSTAGAAPGTQPGGGNPPTSSGSTAPGQGGAKHNRSGQPSSPAPSGSADPSPSPSASPSGTGDPTPQPTPAPGPSSPGGLLPSPFPSPSPSGSGVCVDVGPLGVCLHL